MQMSNDNGFGSPDRIRPYIACSHKMESELRTLLCYLFHLVEARCSHTWLMAEIEVI